MKRIITALALVVGIDTQAGAAEMTAGDLYNLCVSTDRNARNACTKYILGVVHGLSLAATRLEDRTVFCMPDVIVESRLVDIFVRAARADLAADPQDRKVPAISLVGAIMVNSFPCRN
jgi:hypothetical protein